MELKQSEENFFEIIRMDCTKYGGVNTFSVEQSRITRQFRAHCEKCGTWIIENP